MRKVRFWERYFLLFFVFMGKGNRWISRSDLGLCFGVGGLGLLDFSNTFWVVLGVCRFGVLILSRLMDGPCHGQSPAPNFRRDLVIFEIHMVDKSMELLIVDAVSLEGWIRKFWWVIHLGSFHVKEYFVASNHFPFKMVCCPWPHLGLVGEFTLSFFFLPPHSQCKGFTIQIYFFSSIF